MLGAARAPSTGRESAGVLAVTVLTSMDRPVDALAWSVASEEVELLTKMGLEAGIRVFVCSPQEVARCARSPAPRSPGDSPAYAPLEPQASIKSASPSGGSPAPGGRYLVVGRPITQRRTRLRRRGHLKEMAEALQAQL